MTSRIEAGITVEGSIRGEGELEVAGRVRGALTIAGKLTIEETGIVEADVEANEIDVSGVLAGSATAHGGVQVREGGRIEARVRSPSMTVDDGGVFRGELQSPSELDEEEAMRALPAPGDRAARSRGKGVSRKAESAPAKPPEKRVATRGRTPGFVAPKPSVVASAPARKQPEPVAREQGADERPTRNLRQQAPAAAPIGRGAPPVRGEKPAAPADTAKSPHAPTAVAGATKKGAPPQMPSLPRGRTQIKRRGGEP